jgi:hypothetical protein
MNKLVTSLLAASSLSIAANAWAIPDDVAFAVSMPDGPLTVPPAAGGAPGFGPFGSITFELDSVTWNPASLGCRYYYEWIAPGGIAVADGFVVELATHGGANCFANSAAPVPVIPVVSTVMLDATSIAIAPPTGFNRFLQYTPVCQLVLGETVLPGGATLQGVIGFGPSIAPVATELDSIEIDAG